MININNVDGGMDAEDNGVRRSVRLSRRVEDVRYTPLKIVTRIVLKGQIRFYGCVDCAYSSKRKSNIVRHYGRIHAALEKKKVCVCGLYFYTKVEYYRHCNEQHPQMRNAQYMTRHVYKIGEPLEGEEPEEEAVEPMEAAPVEEEQQQQQQQQQQQEEEEDEEEEEEEEEEEMDVEDDNGMDRRLPLKKRRRNLQRLAHRCKPYVTKRIVTQEEEAQAERVRVKEIFKRFDIDEVNAVIGLIDLGNPERALSPDDLIRLMQ